MSRFRQAVSVSGRVNRILLRVDWAFGYRVIASPLKEILLELYYRKCHVFARLAKPLTGRVNYVNVQVSK